MGPGAPWERIRRIAPLLLALVGGCGRDTGLDACDGYTDPINREECRYDALSAVVDDDAALDAALAKIGDLKGRDLALYRLAVDKVNASQPARAQALCRRVTTDDMKQKCASVLGRPHLAGPPKP